MVKVSDKDQGDLSSNLHSAMKLTGKLWTCCSLFSLWLNYKVVMKITGEGVENHLCSPEQHREPSAQGESRLVDGPTWRGGATCLGDLGQIQTHTPNLVGLT